MSKIKKISEEEARSLLESGQKTKEYEPWGLFYKITTDCYGNTLYVAYDNGNGNCYVQDFYTLKGCMNWLRGAVVKYED